MSVIEDLTCREVVELVTAYLEGELPLDEATRVETHVAGCEGCETVVEEMRDTIRLTGMLTEDALTPDQQETLLGAFRGWVAERS
jgi:anti-sigma factor RsiW